MAQQKTASNPNDFILPDLGEGVHEAELIKWLVKEGDRVDEHQILAEMETDKARVEVPSPRAGVIATLHGAEGQILKVGNALVTFAGAAADSDATRGENGATPTRTSRPSLSPARAPESMPVAEDAGTVVGAVGGALGGVTAAPGRALATPAVRRLARDMGVDIDTVVGSGIAGRVTERDVRSASTGAAPSATKPHAQPIVIPGPGPRPQTGAHGSVATSRSSPVPSAPTVPSIPPGQDVLRIPFRGVRRTIANRLRESMSQAVHFNVMDEADVSSLDALRKRLAAASGEKLSFLPFVASAVCRVLTSAEFRSMNATVDEKPNDPAYEASIVQHRAVHIGIATDTDSGLMVPVIRDCDAMGVLEIGRQIVFVAEAARSRSAARELLVGSTFTISNVGSHAGRFATPVINYPEVAILAVGRARPAPVVRGGGIFVGHMLPLSLACDHRVVDGATAALALSRIVELLQAPDSLLAPARG
ncbi:MAG: 2-oxo acid dehydrogenase subunit E2 [Phycisphaerae bacterium]|nr:2-oxo acid dehydrogenase subunit E2 [Phycisphaerae bacterium]